MEVIYSKRMTLAEAMEELPSRTRLEVFDVQQFTFIYREDNINNRIKKAEME